MRIKVYSLLKNSYTWSIGGMSQCNVKSNAVSERSNDFANTVESYFRQSYIEQGEIFFQWMASVLEDVVRVRHPSVGGTFALLC